MAIFTSHDPITRTGRDVRIHQRWGIPRGAAVVALVGERWPCDGE